MFHPANRFDADRDGILHAKLRIVFINGIVAESILADEARIRRIRKEAGGAVEFGRAMLWFSLVIEHEGDL